MRVCVERRHGRLADGWGREAKRKKQTLNMNGAILINGDSVLS